MNSTDFEASLHNIAPLPIASVCLYEKAACVFNNNIIVAYLFFTASMLPVMSKLSS